MSTQFHVVAVSHDCDPEPVRLLDYTATPIQHLLKAVMHLNLQLHHVVSILSLKA